METLFKNLELSSERTKEKLKTEAKLRRQAEKALTETELELRNKSVKIRQLERNDSSALRMVDSGVITEMANNTSNNSSDRELEVVTEELITTQEDLRKAEVQLQRSQALVQHLERNLQRIDNEDPESLSGDDKELLRELDEIRAEINGTRSEKISKFESQLEEIREESSWLSGAMSGLRKIYDQVATTGVADEKSESESTTSISLNKEEKAGQQFEILSLHKQLEATWNENLALQEKVQKLEFVGSSQADPIELVDDDIIGVKFADEGLTIEAKLQKSREECSGMRTEILTLTESLYNAIQSREEAIVSSKEIINVIASKAKEDQVLSTQNEVEKKEKEIMKLEKTLTTSQEKVRLLSLEIARMSSAFEETQDKYDSVAEALKRTEKALAAARDTKDTEIHALKVQFQELNEKNENLVSQVRNAESELLSASKKSNEASAETEARVQTIKELRDDIDQAVNDTNQRNRDVEELALNMEKRVSGAERNVEKIESNIASFTSAIETLQAAQAVAALVEESKPSEEEAPLVEPSLPQSVESDPEGQFNEDDASASTEKPHITKSMHTMRSHSKFDEIIEKVAKYEAQSLHSREIRELELAPVEVSTEERE
jgi:chromosome segregation ATPase